MNPTLKRNLLIILSIIAAVLLTIAVVYFVRKPVVPPAVTVLPSPIPSPIESPTTAPVFVVEQISACTTTFTVACGSSSPSPSPSGSPVVSPSASPSTPPSAALKCVAKKMYEDDSRNRSGFYYLEKEITDTTTIQNGQTIVYNVTTKNAGGNSVPDTTITDKLSDALTYVDGDTGCIYDATSRTVTCTIGTLSPNSEAQRSFRAKVSVSGTAAVANTAEVTSTNGQRDSCSVQVNTAGQVVIASVSPAPTALPVAGVFEVTVGTVGVGFILLLLGALGLLLI